MYISNVSNKYNLVLKDYVSFLIYKVLIISVIILSYIYQILLFLFSVYYSSNIYYYI